MSSIVRQKVGNHTYLYESISYRDENGAPRNRRTPIGKIDPLTELPIYKPEYLDRMAEEGAPIQVSSPTDSFSVDQIKHSTIKGYDAFYLYRELSEKNGLLAALQETFPVHWQELFNLAAFLVSNGDPFMYCASWLEETEAYPSASLSSQRISELLASITVSERNDFYKQWCHIRSEQEYLALDITSTSSYSNLIDEVEWGYNRDGERLPQINLCLLMGYDSRLPIYQSVYSGSLKDVSTLEATIQMFHEVAENKPMVAVMDKGFFSTRNVTKMLTMKHQTDFLIAVPFTGKFAKQQIISEAKDIDQLENTIVAGGETLRAVTKERRWNDSHKVYTHIFYHAKKAFKLREELYTHVATLKELATQHPEPYSHQADAMKYLRIRRSDKSTTGYTISLREDVVEAELATAGWLIIISNCVTDASEAIKIYREKDVVEKGFFRLKNCLDLGRLRGHSSPVMQNKLFVGFISLILLSSIHNRMVDKGLYNKLTLKQLLKTLQKLRVQTINDTRILSPLTKEQKLIYKAFDMEEPV